ncbi:MAG: aminodeoxychorismate synthase component I [Verrucomicrobiota bacterium]
MLKTIEIQNPPSVRDLVERFGRRPDPFILDSSQSNDGLGEWSFFGCEPFEILTGATRLSALRARMSMHQVQNGTGIPFIGGAVGYLSYDYGRALEDLPERAIEDREVPALHFGIYDGIAALNHRTGCLHLVALGLKDDSDIVLERLNEIIFEPVPARDTFFARGEWVWNMSRGEFLQAVEKVRDYIASGDVYQVNLSRRARCEFEGDSLDLYQALRLGNPAPFSAYLNLGQLQIISTSPEQFLRKRGLALETRPIKGTRPRGSDPAEEALLEQELKGSVKDRAELLMIVDLERNDLGKVAEFGSVQVSNLYHLEHYARVMHQTAGVQATLRADRDVYDAIEALFPGGSITGAPKIRAMEIIEDLEPTRRGAYCGSIGYIGFDEDAEFNIAIRSLHLQGAQLDYQVGSGIVWDSDPESEYEETLDKARAIHDTIERLCLK